MHFTNFGIGTKARMCALAVALALSPGVAATDANAGSSQGEHAGVASGSSGSAIGSRVIQIQPEQWKSLVRDSPKPVLLFSTTAGCSQCADLPHRLEHEARRYPEMQFVVSDAAAFHVADWSPVLAVYVRGISGDVTAVLPHVDLSPSSLSKTVDERVAVIRQERADERRLTSCRRLASSS